MLRHVLALKNISSNIRACITKGSIDTYLESRTVKMMIRFLVARISTQRHTRKKIINVFLSPLRRNDIEKIFEFEAEKGKTARRRNT